MDEWITPEQVEIYDELQFLSARLVETLIKLKEEAFDLSSPLLANYFEVDLTRVYSLARHAREDLWELIIPDEHKDIVEKLPEPVRVLWEVAFITGFCTAQRAGIELDEQLSLSEG